MPRVPDLVGRLRLDTRDLDRAKGEVKKFSTSLDSVGGGLGANVGKGLDSLTTSLTSKLGPAGVRVKSALDGIGTASLTSGNALTVGIGAGLIGIGALATAGVGKFVSLTAEIRQFQRASGASAEDASRLVGSMKLLGIEPAAASKAFGLLAKNIETNQKGFAKYNIEVARNKDGTRSLVGTLFSVSDAYNKAVGPVEKANTARAAFGRGYQELVPLLARGRDGLRALNDELARSGLVFDQKALDQGRELALASRELKTALTGLEIQAARAFIPFIGGATRTLTTITQLAGGVDVLSLAIGGLGVKLAGTALLRAGAGLAALGSGFESVAGSAGLLIGTAGELALPVAAIGTGLVITARKADEAVPALEAIDKTVVSWEKHIPLVGGFLAGLDSKVLGFGKSSHKTAASLEELNFALNSFGLNSNDAGSVTQSEIVAGKAWADSNKAVAATLDAVNKSSDDRRTAVLGLVDAESANRRAITTFASALDDVTAKERDLADARRKRGDASRDAITVERSLLSIEDAKSSVVDRERDLADARAGRGNRARELVEAEKALAEARDEAAGAHGVKALAKASSGVADAEERLRAAQADGGQSRDVADATEALTKSRLDAKSAALDLADAREASAKRIKVAEDALAVSQQAAVDAAVAQAHTFQAVAEETAKKAGLPLTVSQSYEVFRSKLAEVAGIASGPVKSALDGILGQINSIPAVKPLTVTVDTIGATNALTTLRTLVDSIKSDTANLIPSLAALGPLPSLTVPSAPNIANLVPAGANARPLAGSTAAARSVSTTNINTTVVAPGVNADVAREIDKRTARAAARAR